MQKIHLDVYKNKNLFIIVGILIIHMFFALFFLLYSTKAMVIANIVSISIYGSLATTFNKKKIFASLIVISVEVPLYTVFTGLMLGAHCGSVFFSYAMICGVYLYSISMERPLFHYILLSLPAVVSIFFIMSWTGEPVYDLLLIDEKLLKIHRTICIAISIFVLGYLCIGQQKDLVVSQKANKKYIERLKFISDHDHLTQIPNRRFITRQLEGMSNFTVAIFDIDNFKSINDTYGHYVGDQILCRLTRCVLSMLPDEAQIGRWGGEEFLIVFPYADRDLRGIMESIRARIADKPFGFETFTLNVSITIGVAWREGENSMDEVIAEADFLLYHGKKIGKNRVIFPTDLD